jgi:glycosyltransferase involved in cell wall biosynthesis
MNMPSPTISIVIPCRNEKEHIETCLHSILAQEALPEGVEIIVADGMSDDGTREILDRLAADTPCLRAINNPGRIVSSGLNAAVREAQGNIIVRMDAHTEYAPDYLSQCVSVLRETGANNVGGPARTKSTTYLQSAICAAYHSFFAVGGARFHNVRYEGYVDTVTYGCWPREVFDRIGFFDEELVRNQDDEFNLRLTRAGGKIWQSPRIRSWYQPRGSLLSLFRQYQQYGYWKVRVIQKHQLPASVRHLVPGFFIFALTMLPLLGLWWSFALWCWLALLGVYIVSNASASLLTAARTQWRLLPVLPLAFACYHFGYGYGFLHGMWDFVLWRRGPTQSYSKITRMTTQSVTAKTTQDR